MNIPTRVFIVLPPLAGIAAADFQRTLQTACIYTIKPKLYLIDEKKKQLTVGALNAYPN